MQPLLTCVTTFLAACRSKTVLRPVTCFLLLATVYCLDLPAQKFELAKISLGMSEQDAKAALGPGYQFFEQPAQNTPNLLYVFAGNPSQGAAYSFALIDGKIQGFQFLKHFAKDDYPLIENLRKSVADKLWQPQQPNGSSWLSDSSGHALADTPQLNCSDYGAGFEDTGFLAINAAKIPAPTYEAMKGLMQPRAVHVDPRCGVFVRVYSTRLFSNPAMAIATGLQVKNIAAFSALERQQQQKKQNQQNSQAKQAQKAKSPF